MITVLTWFWQQENARFVYTADHVNAWARAVRKNTTVPIQLAVVTDLLDGIDSSIRIIDPPKDFESISSPRWSSSQGLPQCYRRIAMFAPHAAEVFGERFLCMDLDCLITGSLDPILQRTEDFIMYSGTSAERPYNGSLLMMNAGARPQVYNDFSPKAAIKASQLYLGSDQAWISYCLGKGEATFGVKDGVHYYSPVRFRRYGVRYTPPNDMRILFYPGPIKVTHAGHSEEANITDLMIAERCLMKNSKLYALRDVRGWADQFAKDNKDAEIVDSIEGLAEGDKLFIRLDQQREKREITKGVAQEAHDKGVQILPEIQDAELYDDKLAQFDVLKQWMPETKICKSRTAANNYLKKLAEEDYPFISKATFGASSSSVRLIENEEQAKEEVKQVFSKEGMPCVYGRVQKGYVYWQKLVEDNPCDYRIVVVGDYIFGLVRNNRKDVPFASGSGDFYPVTLTSDREVIAANTAIQIADEIGSKWVAFDFVFDDQDAPFVLELSGAWAYGAYKDCPMFDKELKKTKLKGRDMFKVAGTLLRGVEIATAGNVAIFRKLKGQKKVVAEKGTDKYQRLFNSKLWEIVG